MTKELFQLLMAEFKKLGINPTKWLGTRTNVKRIGKQNMAATPINKYAIKKVFDDEGPERIVKLFNEESKFLGTLNDMEATQLLKNLKTANKVINPPPKPEADVHMFSELPGKKLTPDEFTGKKAADRAKLESAILKASMKVSSVDRKLAERLGLDMSKVSHWEKLQAWKEKHGIPDWAKDEGGMASLFKTVEDNPLADLGSQLDDIEKQGKSLVEEAQKLTDLAWKMSPEGQAAEEAIRKDILRRGSEGKGFAGGVFGARNDGYFRAIVRPFLIDQHEKGIIKLSDNTLKSLKNSNDIKSGGGNDFMYPDPVRIFRTHYGDNAFDLIPDQEAFGMGNTGYGPGRDRINEVLNKVIGKPILKVGPDTPGGYLTKGEYQAKLDHEDEVLRYINEGDGRFGDMTQEELAKEIAQVKADKASIKAAMDIDYPPSDLEKLAFDPETRAAIGKNITGGFKKGTKKDPFGIRLMKNFDQDLTDEGLAQEGYNLQEIDILKRARNVMKDPEKDVRHPTEAMRWVRGEMADEAGVDVDDFMTDFSWDDTFDPSDQFAQGGGVGSMFRRV